MIAEMNGENEHCPVLNTEYSGHDIHEIHSVPTWQSCWEACKLTPLCMYWSWDSKNERACVLKRDYQGPHHKVDYVSGDKSCHQGILKFITLK